MTITEQATAQTPVSDATLLKWLLDATNPTTRWAGERIKQLKAEPEAINRGMLAALKAAQQRLNESGTGEMGLLDTIHAVHALIVPAIARAEAHGGQRKGDGHE